MSSSAYIHKNSIIILFLALFLPDSLTVTSIEFIPPNLDYEFY